MNRSFLVLFSVLLTLGLIAKASAQSDLDRARNLSTCLNGKFATLCKRAWLNPDELIKTEQAERRENLSTCLQGRYTSLCRKNLLTQDELDRVEAAERHANLAACLKGKYTSLCNKGKLNPEELQRVEAAEHKENLELCLQGKFSALCKHSFLTPEEAAQVDSAERRENLRTCLTGRYKPLCKKNLLNETERQQVLAAEQTENFRTCLSRTTFLCDKSLLTPEQLLQLQHSEPRVAGQAAAVSAATRTSLRTYQGCESGYRIDSVSKSGEVVILDSGSVWEVDSTDAVDAKLWRISAPVAVCETKLVNADLNEAVSVKRVR